jgi:hypothetical protein
MEWNGGRSGRKVRSVVEGSFFTKGAFIIDDDDDDDM